MLIVTVTLHTTAPHTVLEILDADTERMLARDGCNSYSAWAGPDTKGTCLLLQHWGSQDALDAHRASPEFAALGQTLGPHLSGPPETTVIEGEFVSA